MLLRISLLLPAMFVSASHEERTPSHPSFNPSSIATACAQVGPPLDDVAWTETAGRAFTTVTETLRDTDYQRAPVLATSANVTPMAEAELKKLGWTVVALK